MNEATGGLVGLERQLMKPMDQDQSLNQSISQ